VPITRNFSEDVPATIITDINTSFKNRTSEFPSLQSTKPKKSVTAVNNGAWSNPRSKAKLYNTVKAQGGTKQPATPATTKSSRTASGDAEKPNSPKVKVPRSSDSKFDFFKSLRLDEGLIDSDSEKSSYENDCEINGVETALPTPLSSSVETEHRLLKEMGWSDEHEPPLTEEEVLSAKREIETHRDMIETKKKAQSPTVLSPFPWAPKIYLSNEDEELSSDSEDEN